MLGKLNAHAILSVAADARPRGSAEHGRLTAVARKALHPWLGAGHASIRGRAGMGAQKWPPGVFNSNTVPRALRVADPAALGAHLVVGRSGGRLEFGQMTARATPRAVAGACVRLVLATGEQQCHAQRNAELKTALHGTSFPGDDRAARAFSRGLAARNRRRRPGADGGAWRWKQAGLPNQGAPDASWCGGR